MEANAKNKMCESCLMPLGKNWEDAGTEADGTKSHTYCKYCLVNGEMMYKGTDREEFKKIVYENMLKMRMWKPKAMFFTWMINFAPRWKKQ